jgi:serine/threonine protein kinase
MIHSQMSHDNIVKLFEYTETKDEYLLYMEYCDKADHLAAKILEVTFPVLTINSIIHRLTIVINFRPMPQIS